jgi:hypothetical protein
MARTFALEVGLLGAVETVEKRRIMPGSAKDQAGKRVQDRAPCRELFRSRAIISPLGASD